ncbi:MAG: hypothetical protein PF630_00110 [Gammaproteobacteria bacterium]|jgi:hypothetical protein|nr:hypothetical protein [Gammaproteobacteria bacterium]
MIFSITETAVKRRSTRPLLMLSMVALIIPMSSIAQTFPIINFQLPNQSPRSVCLQQGSVIDISSANGDIVMLADAASEDLGCPGENPVINSFSATPAVVDITSLNCDTTGNNTDDSVCLFLNWEVTPAVTPTTCEINQIAPGKFSMLPFRIPNPGAFVDPLNPGVFAPQISGLQWPVNQATVTAGLKRFQMVCVSDSGNPVSSIIESTFQDGATPAVTIDNFTIVQTQAARNSVINFNWDVTLNNNPTAPQCTLSSGSTINPVTVSVTGAPGNSTATILATSPLGNRTFTFACRPAAGEAVTDQSTATVEIIDSVPTNCPAPIVPNRDMTQTTYSAAHGSGTWPAPAGNSFNISVAQGTYKALQFVATSGFVGNYATVESNLSNSESVLLSISECPGDFRQTEIACVDGPALKSRVIWADPADNSNFCDLVPGRTYYLNLYFGDINGNNGCTTSTCVTRGRNQFN